MYCVYKKNSGGVIFHTWCLPCSLWTWQNILVTMRSFALTIFMVYFLRKDYSLLLFKNFYYELFWKDDFFFNAHEIPFFRFGFLGGLSLGMLCLNIYKMTNAFAFSCRISTLGIYFVSSRPCIWNKVLSIVCSDKEKFVKKNPHHATPS